MRVGLLGGAFDPIHLGHVAIAKQALTVLGLDRVLLIPSGEPPYKKLLATRADRMKMVALAARNQAGIEPCDVEINREGLTYAADTLTALTQMNPADTYTYIIGADVLDTLGKWRGIDTVARLTDFAVVMRPDLDRNTCAMKAEALSQRLGTAVTLVNIDGMDISSGRVRACVAAGESIDDMVPAGVADYIRKHGLYLCAMTEAELLDKLRATITLHRYHHTLGVAETAVRLSERFGVDPHRARLAALLHDCAKSMPYGEMRRLVEQGVPDTDMQELEAEPVLHAPAGMIVAARDYGVRDASVLQAIRHHTLGGPNMTAMDALIFVADFIEPGRRAFEGLSDARAMAEKDIFAAARLCAELSNRFLISKGQSPHPKTLAMLETLGNP